MRGELLQKGRQAGRQEEKEGGGEGTMEETKPELVVVAHPGIPVLGT